MYEEEVDLPMDYDRLTEHLQTKNASFDRGLATYLTGHVAMRAALDQAIWEASQNDFRTIKKSQYRDTGVLQSPQQYMLAGQNPLESWAQAYKPSAQAGCSIVQPLSPRLPTEIQALLAVTPTNFTFDNTAPPVAIHQGSYHKRSYSYKPNGKPKRQHSVFS
jgi:hypothetical protein